MQCAIVGRYVEGKKILRQVMEGGKIACGYPQCKDPGAPATVFCSTCNLFFCSTCEMCHQWMESMTSKHDVKSIETIRSGTGQCDVTRLRKAVPLCCPRHRGKVLEYQCEVCDVLMCQACTVAKDSPHSPAYLSAEVPLPPQHLQTVERALKIAACNQEQCRVALETAEGWGTEVERKKEDALQEMRQSFQAICAAIDHRKEVLGEKIRGVSEARKGNITDTVHLYRRKEETLSNRQAMLSFLSTEGSPHEVISYSRLLGAGQTHRRSEAAVSRVMKFLPEQEAALQAAIEGFGCVEVGACPANCTLQPAPDKDHRSSANDPIRFTLLTADQEKTPCSVGGDMIQSFLHPRPPLPGPPIKAVVSDEDNGQYKVTFDLTYTGECELSVLVNGAHIHGSPFVVELGLMADAQLGSLMTYVRLPKRDVNRLGACKGTLVFPQQPGKLTGVGVAPCGTIFVSDYGNHKIHVFDADRKFIRSFGQQGVETGQLQNPTGVTISTDSLLYVTHSNVVDVLKDDGVFMKQIGCGTLNWPWDVAVHQGMVFVADLGNHRVAVFSQDGELIRTIGSEGTGPGQLRHPTGVAISPDGELYVSDSNNGRVQVLTSQGAYIREFGKGQLSNQQKLRFSADKHVLVADRFNHRVAVFNQDGAMMSSLPCAQYPIGLAVDKKENLLVACWGGKCVQIF